jgi:hypothetical protein
MSRTFHFPEFGNVLQATHIILNDKANKCSDNYCLFWATQVVHLIYDINHVPSQTLIKCRAKLRPQCEIFSAINSELSVS